MTHSDRTSIADRLKDAASGDHEAPKVGALHNHSKPVLPFWSGRLRPVEEDDQSLILELLRHAEVRRYLCDDKIIGGCDVASMLKESALLDAQGLGYWIIETAEAWFAGVVGLMPVSPEIARQPGMSCGVEPVIAVAPAFQKRGLALEVMIALLDYATSSLPTHKLVAAVDIPNHRSHRLMRASGFQRVGVTSGVAHDLVLYRHTWSVAEGEVAQSIGRV